MSSVNEEKSLSNKDMEDLKRTTDDIVLHGDPGLWLCVCKASSESQGWMKSTKVLEIPIDSDSATLGCLVQVSTQHKDRIAESVCWVPGVTVDDFLPYDEEEESFDGDELED